MKRISIAGLCLVVMFAMSGIAAGSASAVAFRQVCAYMPVVPETQEFTGLEENKEGYYLTRNECEKHSPNYSWAELIATAGRGPWVHVSVTPGPAAHGGECRHLAIPRPFSEGEPGTYLDSNCTEFVTWQEGLYIYSASYDVVEPVPAHRAYFAICEKTAKSTGEYSDKNCTMESAGHKGTYNLVTYEEGTAPQKAEFAFTDKSNAVTLGPITCKKSKSKGQVTSNTETQDEFTFEKCMEGKKKIANIESGPIVTRLVPGAGNEVLTEYSGSQYVTNPVNEMSSKTEVALGGGSVNKLAWHSKVEIVKE